MTTWNYQQTHFVTSAPDIRHLPSDTGIEVAFAGRSNAGKSSALNTLTNQKNLARTSKTPGRTQLINLFEVAEGKRLVDLPGYGYARRSKAEREKWAQLIERYLQADVTEFLATHDLGLDDIGVYVSHPGGPKIIEAIVSSLGLPDDALELTWRSLAEIGNISSASVLHVLRDTMAKRPPSGRGLMMAMGPGFCSELLLLNWH